MGYTGQANIHGESIAIGRVGALCGNVHLVNPPAWVSDNALVVSAIGGFERKYLAHALTALDLNRWASQNAQPLITGSFVKGQKACCPPSLEQRAITAQIDAESAAIRRVATSVQRAIALLQEYRTALISAAVTGKIDVRDQVSV